MFHPILAAVEPSILIRSGIETGVLIHSRIDEMLNKQRDTSVNFPLIPFYVVGGTE
jgi:hypothetical protein